MLQKKGNLKLESGVVVRCRKMKIGYRGEGPEARRGGAWLILSLGTKKR